MNKNITFYLLCLTYLFSLNNLNAQIVNGLSSPGQGWLVEQDGSNQTNSVGLATNIANYRIPSGGVSIRFRIGFNNASRRLTPGCCNGNSSKAMELSLIVNGITYWIAKSPPDDNTISGENNTQNGAYFTQGSGNVGIGTHAWSDASSGRTTITVNLPSSVTSINSLQFRFMNGFGNSPDDDGAVIVDALNLLPPCSSGTTAPTLSSNTVSNSCSSTTVNINNLVTSTCPSGSSLEWHTVSSNLSSATKISLNPTSIGVSGKYYPVCYDATNNCYGPTQSTGLTVTINSLPPTPTGVSASPASICNGASSTLSALCSSGTLVWYNNINLTGSPISNIVTPSITSTYYAVCNNTICNSTPVSVGVTVNSTPTTPTGASANPATICSGSSSSLTATCGTGNIKWYDNANLTGTALTSNVVSPNVTTNYYGVCLSGTCQSVATSVSVTVNPTPTTPTGANANPATLCSGSNSSLTATCSSGNIRWYANSSLTGTALTTNIVSPSTTTSYYGICSNGTCSSAASEVRITVIVCCQVGENAPTVSNTQLISCRLSGVNLTNILTSTAPAGTRVAWFLNNSHTGIEYSTPTAATPGTYYAFYYDSGNTCYSPPSVAVTVLLDTDCDGVSDDVDADDDNDGILDVTENGTLCTTITHVTTPSSDCDGDGIPNRLDLDSDNDGIDDVNEAGGVDLNGDGMADDNDGNGANNNGVPSTANNGIIPPSYQNNNSIGRYPYNVDRDGDGQGDLTQVGGLPSNTLDLNGDGRVDCGDNSTTSWNDCDPDRDGIISTVDGLPTVWKDAADSDQDLIIDSEDLDDDNDGIRDDIENCETRLLTSGNTIGNSSTTTIGGLTASQSVIGGDGNVTSGVSGTTFEIGAGSVAETLQYNFSGGKVTKLTIGQVSNIGGSSQTSTELFELSIDGAKYSITSGMLAGLSSTSFITNGSIGSSVSTGTNFTSLVIDIPLGFSSIGIKNNPNGVSQGGFLISNLKVNGYLTNCVDNLDTDGDGIVNRLDLDSDGDSCSDAIEGGGSFTLSNLVASKMAGGSTNVTQNLGNVVGTTATTLGIPTIASTGQTIGDAQNGTVQSTDCTGPVPNLNPTISISSLNFLPNSLERDFVVNIFEKNGIAQKAGTNVVFTVEKLTAFTINFIPTSGQVDVGQVLTTSNSEWSVVDNGTFLTLTLNTGVTIPANGRKIVGFRIVRKPNISTTTQNITATIRNGSAGETFFSDNTIITNVTAN
jgi:hypothetical protein